MYVAFNIDLSSNVPLTIIVSLVVLIVLLTELAVSIIVCTLAVVSVTESICPTNPLSDITVIFGSIPSFFPTFIIIVFE